MDLPKLEKVTTQTFTDHITIRAHPNTSELQILPHDPKKTPVVELSKKLQ